MSIFGISLDAADVEAALLAHLEAWMPTTTAEIRRQKDPSEERWPEGVAAVETFAVRHFAHENWPGERLPCLIAHSPGMADDPSPEGDGNVNARYAVILLAIAEGGGADPEGDAKALARLYGSAARMAIMQEPSLGGFAKSSWMGREEVYPIQRGVEAERTLMAVQNPYVIEVGSILDVSGGPLAPLEDPETPPEDRPTVKEGGGSVEVDPVQALAEGGFWDS